MNVSKFQTPGKCKIPVCLGSWPLMKTCPRVVVNRVTSELHDKDLTDRLQRVDRLELGELRLKIWDSTDIIKIWLKLEITWKGLKGVWISFMQRSWLLLVSQETRNFGFSIVCFA